MLEKWTRRWYENDIKKFACPNQILFGRNLDLVTRGSRHVVLAKKRKKKASIFSNFCFYSLLLKNATFRSKFALLYVPWQRLLKSDMGFSWSWSSDWRPWPRETLTHSSSQPLVTCVTYPWFRIWWLYNLNCHYLGKGTTIISYKARCMKV